MSQKIIYDDKDKRFAELDLAEFVQASKAAGRLSSNECCSKRPYEDGCGCVLLPHHKGPHIASGTRDQIYQVWEDE